MQLSMDEVKELPGNTQLFRLAEIDVTTNEAVNYGDPHTRKDLEALSQEAKLCNLLESVAGPRRSHWEVRTVYAAAYGNKP